MKKFVKHEKMAARKPLYIVDASVILKWFFVEEDRDAHRAALSLRQDFFHQDISLEIPHYALAETANIFGTYLSRHETLFNLSTLFDYRFVEHPISLEMASLAVELMKKFPGVSFYDTGYHALALHHGGVFITADEKYYRKTHREGAIMLLKDYGEKR